MESNMAVCARVCCRCGRGRRTCGRRRRGRSWRGTQWSRANRRLRAAASSPPSPSTTWWSPTSCPPTTARRGTLSAPAPWSSLWRRLVCVVSYHAFDIFLQSPSLTISFTFISEEVPVGIIAGGTVGSTILLFIFLLVLVLIFYRQRKGSESYPPHAM